GRSIGAGAFAAILIAAISFLGGLSLIRMSLRSPTRIATAASLVLPLAVTPLLVGISSFAFAWRELGISIAGLWASEHRCVATVVISEGLIQLVRYGPLLVWLFLLTLLQISIP